MRSATCGSGGRHTGVCRWKEPLWSSVLSLQLKDARVSQGWGQTTLPLDVVASHDDCEL